MPEPDEAAPTARAFWSGTITFGLVSIPVDLMSATSSRGVALRMLDARDGTPLKRKYCCPNDGSVVDTEEIVRGYEVEPGRFVVVTDEELESLAPEKSTDIELKQFVDASAVDPMYFERTYFLAPKGRSSKAYHLLVHTMQESGRAGLATFVMHGKEYLVAIFASGGILRASTLRFQDELRTPSDVGLPEPKKPSAKEVKRFADAIEAFSNDRFDPASIEDEYAERLAALVRAKVRQHKDVVESAQAVEEKEQQNVIDLMELLKQRVAAETEGRAAPRSGPRKTRPASKPRRKKAARRSREGGARGRAAHSR